MWKLISVFKIVLHYFQSQMAPELGRKRLLTHLVISQVKQLCSCEKRIYVLQLWMRVALKEYLQQVQILCSELKWQQSVLSLAQNHWKSTCTCNIFCEAIFSTVTANRMKLWRSQYKQHCSSVTISPHDQLELFSFKKTSSGLTLMLHSGEGNNHLIIYYNIITTGIK